jgi:hypothetical protein
MTRDFYICEGRIVLGSILSRFARVWSSKRFKIKGKRAIPSSKAGKSMPGELPFSDV